MIRALLILLAAVGIVRGNADDALRKAPFEIGGSKAFIIAAPTPAAGKPWVWYAPTLGANLPGAGHQWYFERFLKEGISIAGVDLGEVRGSPASTEKFAAFHAEMVKRGYSSKPVLLGQSRGGLMMLAFAVRHPDKVSALAGIYPVCNLASWPMKNSKPAVLADYRLTEADMMANLERFNPIENLQALAAHKVPIFTVHGDNDLVVPLDLNSALLKQRYEALGGTMSVKVVAGEGHKVGPSFFECQELSDFVISKAGR